MIAYLDTQVVVWLCQAESERLSRAAAQRIENSDLLVSPMVLLELEYLLEIKKITDEPLALLNQLRSQLAVTLCDHGFPAIVQTALYESWTRDPFDRIIVAHAKSNGYAPLITSDAKIRKHYTSAIW